MAQSASISALLVHRGRAGVSGLVCRNPEVQSFSVCLATSNRCRQVPVDAWFRFVDLQVAASRGHRRGRLSNAKGNDKPRVALAVLVQQSFCVLRGYEAIATFRADGSDLTTGKLHVSARAVQEPEVLHHLPRHRKRAPHASRCSMRLDGEGEVEPIDREAPWR